MTKLIVTRQAVNAPARKLKATWTGESIREWFPKDPYDRAFENFWHDWVLNTAKLDRSDWGPAVWEPWGFTVLNSKVTIVDEKKFTMFLLRWS